MADQQDRRGYGIRSEGGGRRRDANSLVFSMNCGLAGREWAGRIKTILT